MDSEMAQIIKRLDRFEEKIERISAAMIQLARTEERVSIILEQNTELFRKSSDFQKRISELEKENATQGQSIGFFERSGWLIASAIMGIIGWLANQFFGN